jgi:anti-sigma28 factor (negative regulator of flagellin synthesis)
MKIDRQNPSPETGPLRPTGHAPAKPERAGERPFTARADTVDVSGAARVQELVARAVDAAMTGPDTGRAAVERAKALLESGELGRDHSALANAIIDDLIEP